MARVITLADMPRSMANEPGQEGVQQGIAGRGDVVGLWHLC